MYHGKKKGAKSQYQVCKCGSSAPRFQLLEDERVSCCAKCKTEDMINTAERRCECSKHLPTYGLPNDKRANFCSECKMDGMINLKDKNKKCECGSVIPSFGMKADKKPTCCIKCKKDGMINLTLDLCSCGKSAAFGFVGDKKPSFCLTCKKDGMENIVTKKCKCGKAIPVFGLPADKRATCCQACKTEGMINIGNNKCKCKKAQPCYGFKEDTIPRCCVKCKEEGMIDIRSKKCKCGKSQSSFGRKDDKTPTCCVKCKTKDMINITAKRCVCGKSQPSFGMEGDKCPSCCVVCKKYGMVDIIMSKMCPGLLNGGTPLECPFSQRGTNKYDSYCTTCFEKNFPGDARSSMIRGRSEETIVRDFLANNFENPSFIHNKSIWTGQADCTCRRRIDFRALLGNTLLCIEVDEDQHKYRNKEDEVIRYDDLMMIHGGKFIFIRFNPHLYVDSQGKRKNPSMPTRLHVLKDMILKQMNRIEKEENTELLEIIHMFYDEL